MCKAIRLIVALFVFLLASGVGLSQEVSIEELPLEYQYFLKTGLNSQDMNNAKFMTEAYNKYLMGYSKDKMLTLMKDTNNVTTKWFTDGFNTPLFEDSISPEFNAILTDFTKAMDGMEPFVGVVYRVEQKSSEVFDSLILEGDHVASPGFVTSSFNKEVIRGYSGEPFRGLQENTIMRIKSKTGRILPNANGEASPEVLFKPNTKFKVSDTYSVRVNGVKKTFASLEETTVIDSVDVKNINDGQINIRLKDKSFYQSGPREELMIRKADEYSKDFDPKWSQRSADVVDKSCK